MEKLQKFLDSYPKAKILDVGTGSGQFIDLLTGLCDGYDEIVGIDLSENVLGAGRKQFAENPRIRFERMDARDIKYPDGTFDIVTLSNSLHHLENIAPTIREMERVLKPQGALLFNEMISDHLDARQISHRMVHHFAAKTDRELGIIHRDTYSRDELLELLSEACAFSIRDAWDLTYEHNPENTKEGLDSLLRAVDRQVTRIKDETKAKAFAEEAETIKRYILANGFDSATQVLVVGKK
jgi:ubiquinone/menaquinone biosynthesis C-methylase UbiE